MINKIACLLVIISLFMSAANVNAAEDNTDMQILIANQKKVLSTVGVVHNR